ncbi:MAG: hypothetical protein MUO52_02490 [Desulfobacterales bacterium]|nr:hypothetical protein [Desulfobacterales bacterium]
MLFYGLFCITAAVVGVVLNLGDWFGWQVLFPPEGDFDWFAGAVGLAPFIAIQWVNRGIISVIPGSGTLGLLWHLLF